MAYCLLQTVCMLHYAHAFLCIASFLTPLHCVCVDKRLPFLRCKR